MTTDVQDETEAAAKVFEFTSRDENVLVGDLYLLDHEGGQIVIAITDLVHNGRYLGGCDLRGLATDREGTWCGPWGRIISYVPIKAGEAADITFNQTGSSPVRFQKQVIKLIRVRDGKHEKLLG